MTLKLCWGNSYVKLESLAKVCGKDVISFERRVMNDDSSRLKTSPVC